MKLTLDKRELFLSKIKYLRQIIDAKGRKPDISSSGAIKKMSIPTNLSTLQAFLRLANYYSNFIPNMHVLRAPLNKLFKKDLKWNWSTEYQIAFEENNILTSDLNLKHYDPKKVIIVASDISNFGLGSVIFYKESNGQIKVNMH